MRTILTAILTSLVLAGTATDAAASSSRIVYSHSGAQDPLVEGGWARVSPGTDEGPLEAWVVDDASTTVSSRYQATPPALQPGEPWEIEFDLTIDDAPNTMDYSVGVEYADGSTRYAAFFTVSSDRAPSVMLWDGSGTTSPLPPESAVRSGHRPYDRAAPGRDV